ncbi:ABC transporter permease [Ruminococcus sp. CLA-AA-H200]|uniref:ABC transporter permease n=1 Tax=Ruminococcus turbiniformis TaxID=2881258 RepID=A0ABS8FSX7_9FIRM|nr:ABC transporter permease [Ruminococcus turbiniformis]MCC2253145.1 ABC transporter permease [Ruminococcus turbiniformis]
MKKEFQPVKTLNRRTFRKNRGRNIVAVLAILMTTIMFTTLFTLAQSMNRNMVEMMFRQSGYDAHVSFKSITEEEAESIRSHPDVQEVGESTVLGLAENTALSGMQTEIRWGSDSYASHSFAFPEEGRMPESADEIALDTRVLDRLGIPHKLGERVELSWRKDLNSDEMTTSTFTLCGYWTGNESSYAAMAWVSPDYAGEMTDGLAAPKDGQVLGTHMAQVTLNSDRDIESTMNRVLEDKGLENLEYGVNLAWLPETNTAAFEQSLPMYLGMILVFLAGYLIIYNIFQIGVTADVQFYGRLKTLGMTNRQIRKLIYGQANRLCLLGIPAGLILGWLLGVVLVPVLLGMMEGEHIVSANPVIFIGSALFTWLTVLISCLRPARMAGKVSPIEALRASDASTGGKKKRKRSQGSASVTSMAWANLGRNKKRTVTVICSLSLGLVLLCSFYAKNAAFDMDKYLEWLTIADFQLSDATHEDRTNGYDPQGTTLNDDLIEELSGAEGVTETGHQYSHQFLWQMDETTQDNFRQYYTEERLADWASYNEAQAASMEKNIQTGEISAVIFGLDGIPLDTITSETYIQSGEYDPEAFATGEYILAVGPATEPEYLTDPVLPAPSVGSTVTLEGKTYTVMAVVYPLSSVDGGASEIGTESSQELHFIIPSDTFREQWPDNTLRQFFLNAEDGAVPELQAMIDDYTESVDSSLPVTSRQTMAEQYEEETRSSAVMGNAISLIIALIGILNFINSMATAIVSRKREFAMIQSVGMTKRQLRQMLISEGLFYALITIIVSLVLSSIAISTVIRAMVEGGYSTYHFTLLPLAVCAPVLIVFAVIVPWFCFRNLERQSIVERLRME